MTPSTHGCKLALACALLIASGCERHLIIDDGGGNAGASAGEAGEAGAAGDSGQAAQGGASAGDGIAGAAGAAGAAGTGEAGAAGQAGSAGGSAGSAGAAGAAGGDGIGGQFGDQPPVTTRWTGNDASCPTEPVYSGACAVEGLVCGYYTQEDGSSDTSYSECACHMSCTESGTDMQWECHGNGGDRLDLCPAEQPEEGSSCFGLKGVQCYYPVDVACGCPSDAEDSSWHCEHAREPAPAHPTVVDAGTIVSEMTDEERATWCAWYAPAETVEPGFPEPTELEPTEDGFYPYTGCASTSSYGCGTLLPIGLPASACEDNLALSTCTATVRELNDCVLTAGGRAPAPNGCARYLNTAGCPGTLVNRATSEQSPGPGFNDACLVRVR